MTDTSAPLEGQSNDLGDKQAFLIEDLIKKHGDELPKPWIDQQGDKSVAQMQHWVGMSFLMEKRFAVEREQFLSELKKQIGKTETAEDVNAFIGKAQTLPDAGRIFRSTAPGAAKVTQDYIHQQSIDPFLKNAGIPLERVTPGTRNDLNVSLAYAKRVSGDKEGNAFFEKSLPGVKDAIVKGLGDRRVTLAIAGSMLGMTVMAGAGPVGIVISGAKFGHKLLQTDKGKEFQKGFVDACKGFLMKLGVPESVLEKANKYAVEAWDKTGGTRWGQTALVGVAIAASVGAVGAISINNLADIVKDGRLSWNAPEVYDMAKEAISGGPSVSGDALPTDASGVADVAVAPDTAPSATTATPVPDASVPSNTETISSVQAQGTTDIVPKFSVLASTEAHISAALEQTKQFTTETATGFKDVIDSQAAGVGEKPYFRDLYTDGNSVEIRNPSYDPDNFTAAVNPSAPVSSIENGMCPPYDLPAPTLCDVEAGDTLWEIAERHYTAAHPGVEPSAIELANMVNEIAGMNDIADPNLIFEGQTLSLPQDVHPDTQVIAGNIDWMQHATPTPSNNPEIAAQAVSGLSDSTEQSGQGASSKTAADIAAKWLDVQGNDSAEEIALAALKSNRGMSI